MNAKGNIAQTAADVLPARTKRGSTALAVNDETKTVTFPTPYPVGTTPLVQLQMVTPEGGYVIEAAVEGAPTRLGFVARLGAAIPDEGYELHWIATPRV